MFRRVVKSLAALVVLLALLVGAPIALWTFGRSLLPTKVPSWSAVWDALWSRDDGTLFLSVLLIVGVVAWLVFAVCVIVELAAMLAGQRGRWHLPGLGMPQRAVSALLALIFTGSMLTMSVGTAAASPVQHLPAAVHASVGSLQATHPQGHNTSDRQSQPTRAPVSGSQRHVSAAHSASGPVWTVQRYDTLWSIAEKSLGDGRSFQMIVELNIGVAQPDGKTLHTADTSLEVGWRLRLPAGAKLPEHTDLAPVRAATARPTTVTVGQGDTLSQIAQDELGDADKYPGLAKVNHLRDPNLIDVGQTIIIPAPGQPDTQVHRPTADPHHGQAPADRPAPHPAAPQHPVVKPAPKPNPTAEPATPGQHPQMSPRHTQIPAPTPDASPRAPVGQTQEDAGVPAMTPPRAPASSAPTSAVTIGGPATPAASAPEMTAAQKTGEQQRPQHVPGRVHHPATVVERPAGSESGPAASDVAVADQASSSTPAFLAAGGGVLLASLVAGALWSRRRRQFRHRRSGHTIARAPAELAATERGLLSVADPAMADVGWLDRALRGLVHRRSDTGEGELPDLTAVRMSGNLLELHLAGPSTPPPPWTANADGTVWTLRRGEDTGYRAGARAFQYAPYPMLVSIGHTPDGDRWLLDLEHMAAVMLTGDEERGLNLARFLAAELAHNTWSELLQVTLVGFGAEMAELNVERVTQIPDAQEAIAAVRRQAESVPDAAAVLAERACGGGGEPWTPHVLLVAGAAVRADRCGVDELVGLLRSQSHRSSIALILDASDSDLAGDDGPADEQVWRVHLTTDGILEVPQLGVELVAEQLPEHEARDLARLLVLAAQVDDGQQMAAARGKQPWDEYADAAGLLRDRHGRPHLDEAAIRVADSDEPVGTSVLPLTTNAYVQAAPTTAEDVRTLAPEVDPQVCQQILSVSDGLDAELAAWADLDCPRPKIRVLGPVEVQAQGKLPADKPRRPWNCEVVAFLASRPQGVTAAEFGTAMWPQDPDIEGKTKLRQSISIARKWLGVNQETGREHIPSNPGVPGQLYRLEGALVDAELFRRLRIRGAARGQDGIADLQAALGLVSGPPFHQLRVGSYSWLADTPLHHEYTAMIADTAHTVAVHFHAVGDPLHAAEAAKVALLAGGPTDAALLDLAEACYAMGQDGEAARWLQELMVKHEAEVEEELPRRTYDVLLRKGWLGKAG